MIPILIRATVFGAFSVPCILTGLASPAIAQQPPVVSVPARAATDVETALARPRIPLHSYPDEPERLWAGGARYKVAFGAHVEFVPYLGANYPRPVALRWRTTAIRFDGAPLVETEQAPTPEADAFECIYTWQGSGGMRVRERYEVRLDGVEQTFTLAKRPRGTGALVVEGRIDGGLHADPRPLGHAPIDFFDVEGRPVVRYGAATVVDAAGHEWRVGTAFERGTISIVVEPEVVQAATFPLVIDPFAAVVYRLDGVEGDGVLEMDLARGLNREGLLVYTIAASNSDRDVVAVPFDGDYDAHSPIFTDVSSTRVTKSPSATYVAGKWVIAIERTTSGGPGSVQLHFHDVDDPALRTSTQAISPIVVDRKRPRLGAGLFSTAFLVCEEEQDRIRVARIQVASEAVDSTYVIPSSNGTLRRRPTISDRAAHDLGSVVAWQEYVPARSDWNIVSAVVGADGLVGSVRFDLPVSGLGASHEVAPVVACRGAGTQGPHHAVIGFSQLPATGTQIGPADAALGRTLQTVSLRWQSRDLEPQVGSDGVVRSAPSNGMGFLDITQNSGETMFGATFKDAGDAFVCRLGYMGNIVETQALRDYVPLPVNANVATVRFSARGEFDVVSSAPESDRATLRHFRAPAPHPLRLDPSCNGYLHSFDQPNVGLESFSLQVNDAAPSAPVVLLVGIVPTFLPLTSLGMPGCVLHVDPAGAALQLASTTNQSGDRGFAFPLPDRPYFTANLFAQAVIADPSINNAGLGLTNGLVIVAK